MPKKTFDIAQSNNKSLIIQLKENQKELLQNCNDIILFSKHTDIYQTEEKSRNRIEQRIVQIYTEQSDFIEDKQWSQYIKTVISVERITQVFNTKQKRYNTRQENAVYLSNYQTDAKQAYRNIRNHWFIENKDHHVRDETMGEDYSRIRVNPQNMSTLRSFALNILRKNKISNINCELYENSLEYYNLYSYQQFL